MVKVRFSRQLRHEDFVCADTNQNKFLISPKHIFAILSVIVISASLVLPMQILTPYKNLDDKLISQQYLASNDDEQAVSDITDIKGTNDTSKENYEDYELPSTLFAKRNNVAKDLDIQISSKQDNKAFTKNEANKDDLNQIARPSGDWYTQTVHSGDTLSKIFTYLNLPYATLKKVTSAAKPRDLELAIGEQIHFLIDSSNIVKEVVKPLDDNLQVRFTRLSSKDSFTVVYEAINAHVANKSIIKEFKAADTMPLAIQGQKEREEKEKQRQLAYEREQKRLKELNINPNRPRLVIATINKGENFKSAAYRAGLTPSEITTIEKSYSNKINARSLQAGDSFRVLFNEIGTKATINAIEIKSQNQGHHSLYRNVDDGVLYEERGFTPTVGVFRRFPLAGNIVINSKFNPHRKHPVTGRRVPHKGVDFKAKVGTPVYAPADGVVTFAGYQRAAGYYMIVRHQGNYSTVYMHLSKIEKKRDEKVTVGEVIAKTGNTGRTTGPHLHYEIRINDRAVDPLKIDLPKSNHQNLAQKQKEAFSNNVKVFKNDLYTDSLAKNN